MRQCADTLLMVRPSRFGFNSETAISNAFQSQSNQTGIAEKARQEFDLMVSRLKTENIRVLDIDDNPKVETPDAVFPNNWVTMHADGKLIMYPMAAANRRLERRDDLYELLVDAFGLQVREIIDLSEWENQNHYLEGTGSMIFDHMNRTVYMARSIRSSEKTLDSLCEWIGYQPMVFNTKTYNSQPVYHTNVLLSIGEKFAVVCLSAIAEDDRPAIISSLEKTGRNVVDISESQMFSFAGNLLEIRNQKQDPFIALSRSAVESLNKRQIKSLEQYATLLPMEIPIIERHGGGSVRCMIAEVFLPTIQSQIHIKQVTSQQDLEKCFQIRFDVLRKPWNQPVGSERDDTDSQSWHFLVQTETGKAVATARLHAIDDVTGQIRYMAV
ncbi:MAG: citrulline utilization hydrolase CtlX, partial [Bacteroidota bacterium]